jgi:hypothetical protein
MVGEGASCSGCEAGSEFETGQRTAMFVEVKARRGAAREVKKIETPRAQR